MIDFNPFAPYPHLAAIARRYLWTVPIVAALGLVNGLLEGIGIGLLIPLLGTLIGSADALKSDGVVALLETVGAGLDSQQRLIFILMTMLGIMGLKNILLAANKMFIARIDGQAGHEIRQALSNRLLKIGYPFHLSADPAHLVNIVSNNSWQTSDAMRAAFGRIGSFAAATIFGVLLVAIEWRLAIIVVAGALMIRLIQSRFAHQLRGLSERITNANWKLADRMLASVYQTRIVRLFNREDAEQREFAEASENVRRALLQQEKLSAVMAPTLEMLHILLFVTVMLLAIVMGISFPVLAAFLVLLNRLQPHLRSIEEATAALASTVSQVREVEWLLDPTGKPPAPTGDAPFRSLNVGITFHGVSFQYAARPDAAPALAGASFTIAEGRSTALIGRSGSGKSTVVNLMCRLLEPTAGHIEVDGRPLSSLDPVQWLRAISVAGQDVDLIDGTLAENICFGARDLSQEAIEKAAYLADADGFIEALPEGYETLVGTRGTSLSGGQRQRIGLARALARRPSILILDEATNAVDGLSEAAIIDLLRKVPRRMTLIVISHRISTLALCEYGVVLENGRVEETGPLQTLAAYRKMTSAKEASYDGKP